MQYRVSLLTSCPPRASLTLLPLLQVPKGSRGVVGCTPLIKPGDCFQVGWSAGVWVCMCGQTPSATSRASYLKGSVWGLLLIVCPSVSSSMLLAMPQRHAACHAPAHLLPPRCSTPLVQYYSGTDLETPGGSMRGSFQVSCNTCVPLGWGMCLWFASCCMHTVVAAA